MQLLSPKLNSTLLCSPEGTPYRFKEPYTSAYTAEPMAEFVFSSLHVLFLKIVLFS